MAVHIGAGASSRQEIGLLVVGKHFVEPAIISFILYNMPVQSMGNKPKI